MDSYMRSRQANPKESYKRSAKITFIALLALSSAFYMLL